MPPRARQPGAVHAAVDGHRRTGHERRLRGGETDIDVVMLAGRYTLLDQSAMDTLLPACVRRGIGIMNAAVFNSGILAQRQPDAAAHFEYAAAPRDVLDRAREIAQVCEAHGTTLPAAALAFAAAPGVVTSIVVGADSAQQVRANAVLLSAPPPPELWDDLRERGLIPPATPRIAGW